MDRVLKSALILPLPPGTTTSGKPYRVGSSDLRAFEKPFVSETILRKGADTKRADFLIETSAKSNTP